MSPRAFLLGFLCAASMPGAARADARDLSETCRPAAASAPGPAKLLGVDHSGVDLSRLEGLGEGELLGALKMSGIWVSRLSPDKHARLSAEICAYTARRKQALFLEMPVSYSDADVGLVLEHLVSSGCAPAGFSIGNEVDRLVAEGLAARYAVEDYVADYNRITPLLKKRFPAAKIVALELSSFKSRDAEKNAPPSVLYKPVFDWLVPFSRARLASPPDYVSVHYYPFDGAQREWETLSAGAILRGILSDLGPQLAAAPPLILGEFNATYQYHEALSYPGSGGDSFMAALAVPDMLSNRAVAGLFHWSLVEPKDSTLGLYSAGAPAPLFLAYRVMSDALDRRPAKAEVRAAGLEAYAFSKGGDYKLVLVNTTPFFRRNVAFSGEKGADVSVEDFRGCAGFGGSATLPPFSIGEHGGKLTAAVRSSPVSFAYADRSLRTGDAEPGKAYCAPLADFSGKDSESEPFKNKRYDQNAKIATGGTLVALSSPGGRTVLTRENGALNVACELPGSGAAYYQCGAKLPLVADGMADRGSGADWRAGLEKGFLRIKVETDRGLPLELHLEDFQSGAFDYNTHRRIVDVSGSETVDVPIRTFSQAEGAGSGRALADVLGNAAALRIETRRQGFAGSFKLRSIEVCDVP